MADQGFEPTSGSEPAAAVPVTSEERSAPVPHVAYHAPVVGADDRRRRRRNWWIAGVVVVLLLLSCACVVPTLIALGRMDSRAFDLGSMGQEAVAVIRVDGVIAGTGDYYSGYITPEFFLDKLQQAEDDDRVKAILLRVDSPGGTVAASEELAEYVRTCSKPVVVSIGDIGASGAYMLASQADEIWAMPGSSVGSIGVIIEIPNVAGLLDKLGVEFQVITAGKYKDAGSPYRELTKQERALIKGEIDDAYKQFIDIVAKGRGMSVAEVTKLATGWAWSGERARELGLIDEIGTYQQALDATADIGGIKGDYDVVTYEDELGSLLSPLLGLSSRLGGLGDVTSGADSLRNTVPR